MSDYNAKVRMNGPDEQVIESGGKQTVQSGGIVDFESGAALKIAGVQVISDAAELNKLDGNYVLKAIKAAIAYNVADPFTVTLGTIPNGAIIVGTIVEVSTLFNAGTTNVLTVGHGAGLDEFVAAGDVNEGAAGTTLVGKMSTLSADKVIKAKFVQTGGAATTGAANVTVLFLA